MTQRTTSILSYALFTATLLWGGFSFIAYLGVPVHQLVYRTQSELAAVGQVCGTESTIGTYLCAGMESLLPFLKSIFLMGSPFFAYTILSILAFAGVLIWSGYRTGFFHHTLRFRPLILIGLFGVSVWLLGTTFSLGTLSNLNTPENEMMVDATGHRAPPPFRRFIEPTAQVYDGAGDQTLSELRQNYQDLLDRGCLRDTRLVTRDAKVYELSFVCMQGSLFARTGGQLVLVLFFLFNLVVLGSFLIVSVLRIRQLSTLNLLCLSFGAGALGWSAILWTISLVGLLQAVPVRILFIGMPFLLFRQSWWWLRRSWETQWEVEFSLKNVGLLLGWLLISYLALNFLNVVRPFPIGWDDLGSYLNRPRLLASYGSFIPSVSQFQWEFLTSLGFVLFGYDSTAGSTFAMQINWSAGLISVLVIFAFARIFLGRGAGILAAMLYYFLPMTGHFSFADMKIDNASFFTGALALLAASLALFPQADEDGDTETEQSVRTSFFTSDRFRLFFLAGILAGFNFAVKPTGILSTFFVCSIIAGSFLGPLGFAAAAIGSFGVLSAFGPLHFGEIFSRIGMTELFSNGQFFTVTVVLMLALLVIAAVRYRQAFQRFLPVCGVFIAGFLVAVAPWMARNALDARAFSIGALLSARDTTAPQVSYMQEDPSADAARATPPTRYLPAELKLDPEDPACKSSAKAEELDRYWGFGKGISHYIGLPWRQVMNIDAFGYYVTLIPALLLFLLLLLYPSFWEERHERVHIVAAGILGVWLLHIFLTLFAVGWYLALIAWLSSTTVGMALLSLFLLAFALVPFTSLLWRQEYRWLGLLFAGTWVFLIQWILVGNGVVWYGIGMFLGFAIVLEALIRLAPDSSNRWLMITFISLSILICLINRLWQFDSQRNLFEYSLGKISAAALRESTIPNYDDIRHSVELRRETMPDTPYTYRIGTFISYFIPKNREVFPLADHQMQFFNCINQERDHALTVRRLKALGFNGIIFDTNTQTIERDPNGPLHRKVQAFTDFANDTTTGVQVVVNDPGNGIAYILLP